MLYSNAVVHRVALYVPTSANVNHIDSQLGILSGSYCYNDPCQYGTDNPNDSDGDNALTVMPQLRA